MAAQRTICFKDNRRNWESTKTRKKFEKTEIGDGVFMKGISWSPSGLPLPLCSLPFDPPLDGALQRHDNSQLRSSAPPPPRHSTHFIKSPPFARRLRAFIALVPRVFTLLLVFIPEDVVVRRHAEVVVLFDEQLDLQRRRRRMMKQQEGRHHVISPFETNQKRLEKKTKEGSN